MEENIKKQNLSKIASKNSVYSLSSILIAKFGGLVFTIIAARFLLPELFGIYSLVLSVVSIAITFIDLGIDSSSVKFIAEALGKNKESRARSYFRFFLKTKSYLVLIVVSILLLISKYLSYNLFDKPLLFYPLIFACLFIAMESFRSLFSSLFIATKNLKVTPFLELVLQGSKILFSLFAILLLTENARVSGVFAAFTLSGVLFFIATIIILSRKNKELFFGERIKIDKSKVLKYTWFIGLTNLSLTFFLSMDTLILGTFVEAAYLGYYRAALTLILSFSALFSISGVLLPIFAQIENKRLERGFYRTLRYVLIISVPAFLGLLFVSKQVIKVIYGPEYLTAAMPLYPLALLVVVSPLVSLYSTIFTAKGKAKDLARFMIISLFINIILNFVLIKYFLRFSQEAALVGAGIAVVVSTIFLLISLNIRSRKQFKFSIGDISFYKIIIAGLIMSVFLFFFNRFVNVNLILGIVEILIGAGIYFVSLILMKAADTEDWNLIKGIFKK